jgi:hypothetical protein
MTEKPARARETYQAYLRGDITIEEAVARAQAWMAARQRPTTEPPKVSD